jgi:hypothetical protein
MCWFFWDWVQKIVVTWDVLVLWDWAFDDMSFVTTLQLSNCETIKKDSSNM